MKRNNRHAFVVCAYEESLYLEECIISLINQKCHSDIIIVTSTPNASIEHCAEKYNLPIYINRGKGGIDGDWNYALNCAEFSYITIAHQDDVYDELYSEKIMDAIGQARTPLILFTNYAEIRDGEKVYDTSLLKVKRFLLFLLKYKFFQKFRWVRRRILGMGNPICCPSVTYCMENLHMPLFREGLKSNLDWEAWERLSKQKGEFVYLKDVLMYHRIHRESTTSKIIGDNKRFQEDFYMLCRFWPKWIAKLINHHYVKAEKSNSLE